MGKKNRSSKRALMVVDDDEIDAPTSIAHGDRGEVEAVPKVEPETPPPDCPYLTSIISVLVGPSQQVFQIHSGVLPKDSKLQLKPVCYYNSRLSVPDEDPMVFELVSHYLYTGDYSGYSSPKNPLPGNEELEVTLLRRHIRLYCFAHKYDMDELAMLTAKNINDCGRTDYQHILSAAREVYGYLHDDSWFRDYFQNETKKAMRDYRNLAREPWILDCFQKEKGSFIVDLFTLLTEKEAPEDYESASEISVDDTGLSEGSSCDEVSTQGRDSRCVVEESPSEDLSSNGEAFSDTDAAPVAEASVFEEVPRNDCDSEEATYAEKCNDMDDAICMPEIDIAEPPTLVPALDATPVEPESGQYDLSWSPWSPKSKRKGKKAFEKAPPAEEPEPEIMEPEACTIDEEPMTETIEPEAEACTIDEEAEAEAVRCTEEEAPVDAPSYDGEEAMPTEVEIVEETVPQDEVTVEDAWAFPTKKSKKDKKKKLRLSSPSPDWRELQEEPEPEPLRSFGKKPSKRVLSDDSWVTKFEADSSAPRKSSCEMRTIHFKKESLWMKCAECRAELGEHARNILAMDEE